MANRLFLSLILIFCHTMNLYSQGGLEGWVPPPSTHSTVTKVKLTFKVNISCILFLNDEEKSSLEPDKEFFVEVNTGEVKIKLQDKDKVNLKLETVNLTAKDSKTFDYILEPNYESTITLTVDVDCMVVISGERRGELKANISKKYSVRPGNNNYDFKTINGNSIYSVVYMVKRGENDYKELEIKQYYDKIIREEKSKAELDLYNQAKTFKTIEKCMNYLDAFPYGSFADDVKVIIEEIEWDVAISRNDLTAFQDFIKKYPNSKKIGSANKKVEDISWVVAEKVHSTDSYNLFITNHPNSEKVSIAKTKIKDIAWANTKTINTKVAYSEFINKFSKFDAEVNEAKLAIENIDWQLAVKENTISSFETFLKGYGSSNRTTEAQKKLEELYWKNASASNSIKDYNKYIELYRNTTYGIHLKDAYEGIEKIEYSASIKTNTIKSLLGFINDYPKSTRTSDIQNAICKLILEQTGIKMVYVKGDKFITGQIKPEMEDQSIDSKNIVLKDFLIGKYEVTQKQYFDIMENNPSTFPCDSCPVETVNWDKVQAYISALNIKTEKKFRLPTEAEWEYAAIGGKSINTNLYDEKILMQYAFYQSEFTSSDKPQKVGKLKPNDYGIYDIFGNVREICHPSYDWVENGVLTRFTHRGGSYNDDKSQLMDRSSNKVNFGTSEIGFRLVLEL